MAEPALRVASSESGDEAPPPEAGAALAAWREDQGVPIELLGAALGLDPGTVARIETGEIAPAADVAIKIAAASWGAVTPEAWEIEGEAEANEAPLLAFAGRNPAIDAEADQFAGWRVRILARDEDISRALTPDEADDTASTIAELVARHAGGEAERPIRVTLGSSDFALTIEDGHRLAGGLRSYAELVRGAAGSLAAARADAAARAAKAARTQPLNREE